MKLDQELKSWKPIKGLKGLYKINNIKFINKTMSIELSSQIDKNSKIVVLFDGPVESYKYKEKKHSKIWEQSIKKDLSLVSLDWSFFKVTNSNYLKWLSEKSCGVSNIYDFIHFVIVDTDKIIEVIYLCDPEVCFL